MWMRSKALPVPCALLLGALLLAATSLGAQDRSFEWSETMRPGSHLAVRGITGDIRVRRASGSTASVMAEKDGRSRDYAEVDIRVVRESDGYTICAVYHPHEGDGGDCDHDHEHDRREHHGRDHDVDVEVRYLVELPDGVELIAAMVTGDVTVEGVRSDVSASTVTGDVSVSTTGHVEANTVSGSLDLEIGSLDWDRLSFHTVSGDITVWLPSGLETSVDFDSLSGDLDSDFELDLTERRSRRWVGSRVRGVIGDGGGRELSFKTVSGDVRLRRSGSSAR